MTPHGIDEYSECNLKESEHALLLGLLGVPGPGLGLAERTDGSVPVDLLVAGQAALHRRRLLAKK